MLPRRRNYAIKSAAVLSTTPSILPARPPSLLPLVAVKAALAQLLVDRIMRLAHPPAELVSVAHARLVAVLHPRPEIVRAYPAGVHLAKEADELLRLALLSEGGSLRVVGCHAVQKSPGGAAELLDVGRAVGGEGEGGSCASGRCRRLDGVRLVFLGRWR